MVHTKHPTNASQAYSFQVELEGLFSKSYFMTVMPMMLSKVALAFLAPQALVAAFIIVARLDHRAGLPTVKAAWLIQLFGLFVCIHTPIIVLRCCLRHSLSLLFWTG